MAGSSGAALAEVTTVDRKKACLACAAACRERAEADAQNHDYWMKEATRWLDVAQGSTGPVAVTFEADGHELTDQRSAMRSPYGADGFAPR
jgi:hypothetical protein